MNRLFCSLFLLLCFTISAYTERHMSFQSVLDAITSAQEAAWSKPEGFYVLYTPDSTGWGNQVRGISSSLILALLTGRRFVIYDESKHHSIYFDAFHEPAKNFSLKASKHNVSMKIGDLKQKTLLSLGHPIATFKVALEEALVSKHTVIQHFCGGSFAEFFFHETYRPLWKTVFGSDFNLRWDEIEAFIMAWLFQNPMEELISSVKELKKALMWDTFEHHGMIQYRSWQDAKINRDKALLGYSEQVACVNSELEQLRVMLPSTNSSVLLYLTSDDKTESERLHSKLVKIPNLTVEVYQMYPNVHTAHSRMGNLSISRNQGMVDWYLLGMVDYVVCSGTSYCASARGRTGIGRSTWSIEDVSRAAPFNDIKFSDEEVNSHNIKAARGVTVICPKTGEFLWIQEPYNRALSRPNHSLAWYVPPNT